MRKSLQIIFGIGIAMGIVSGFSDLFSANSGGSMFNAGRVVGSLLLSLISGALLVVVRKSSPEYREEEANKLAAIKQMPIEDLKALVGKELCRQLGMRPEDANREFCEDLRVPKGRLMTELENIGIDYHLPITGDDADHLRSLEDVYSHLEAWRSSMAAEQDIDPST